MPSLSSETRRRPLHLATVFLAALALPACQRGDRKPVFPVNGSVFYQGRPAEGARVVFHPGRDPNAHALRPQAVVGADGSFRLTTYTGHDGAPAGEYFVTVYSPAPGPEDDATVRPDLFGYRYADPRTTPLTANVPSRSVTLDRFDLR